MRVSGLGFRVEVLGFRVEGLFLRVKGVSLRVKGSGFNLVSPAQARGVCHPPFLALPTRTKLMLFRLLIYIDRPPPKNWGLSS